ncbi:MAG: chemotaxis protein CheB, partial [Pseudomonadota bacterium]
MPDTTHQSNDELTIVAIAASAGGLEATSLLAQNMPHGQNCCYVIAQHMAPARKSLLVQLLSRETSLGVIQLSGETRPLQDTVYVPPPGQDVVYEDGMLRLLDPSPNPATPKPSADRLFKTVAEEKREYAIGIVLSGTGSDGSYGVQSIREYGGITIAQEPTSCKYDSMPSAAIQTGCVDLVLTPEQMGLHINQMVAQPRDLRALQDLNADQGISGDLFEVIKSHTGVDFRHYKETTLNRRIQRRMLAKNIADIDAYTELCRQSVEEVEELYRDLLISVTQFFRDPDQFIALQAYVKELVTNRKAGRPIRVWIPAAASGEEAYTIAMMFCEELGGLEDCQPEDLQIFATDIDDEALERGRAATYPVSAMVDIPDDRFGGYFEVQGDHIVMQQKLRRIVMFSRHNVFQDAPFI